MFAQLANSTRRLGEYNRIVRIGAANELPMYEVYFILENVVTLNSSNHVRPR